MLRWPMVRRARRFSKERIRATSNVRNAANNQTRRVLLILTYVVYAIAAQRQRAAQKPRHESQGQRHRAMALLWRAW